MEAISKNKIKSSLVTVFFHTGLLLLLIFFGFKIQIPPPPELGILVNFGTTDFGSGPEDPKINKEEKIVSVSDNESVLTQDFEQAHELKKNPIINKEEEKNKNEQTTKEEQRQVDKNTLFPGNNNSESSEGNEGNQGNQGDKEGDPNAKSHSGSTDKGGISYSLGGRNIKGALPKPLYPGNEQGKVVVEIFVDRYGKVIKATAGVKGTTLLSQQYLDAAYKAALQAQFDSNTDAPEIQKGTITYKFMLQ